MLDNIVDPYDVTLHCSLPCFLTSAAPLCSISMICRLPGWVSITVAVATLFFSTGSTRAGAGSAGAGGELNEN